MRYPASEKLEIIRLVEESHLSARLTLAKLGNPPDDVLPPLLIDCFAIDCRSTGYDRYLPRDEAG